MSPDRALLLQFGSATTQVRAFQVLAEVRGYPTIQVLEMRMRQLRPEVILLDMKSEPSVAGALLTHLVHAYPSIPVIGISDSDNTDVLKESLRQGVSEFLFAPFEPREQREAALRLVRLRPSFAAPSINPSEVLVFTNAKPGSGGSTLAMQTAFSIRLATNKKVLLIDFNLTGGSAGLFATRCAKGDLLQALRHAGQLNPDRWGDWVTEIEGVEVLAAPDGPYSRSVDLGRVNCVLEFARTRYEWIIADAPVVFSQISLGLLPNADRAILVSTAEVPSLHLARKAIRLLEHVGFPKERMKILVNRLDGGADLSPADLEKLFPCPVCAAFPNEYFLLNRLLTLRRPLDSRNGLGRAVSALASSLVASGQARVA